MKNAIKIQNLDLAYEGVNLFEQLNLSLPENQWSALLGPSGVGKTSLLRLIAGLPHGGLVNTEATITQGKSSSAPAYTRIGSNGGSSLNNQIAYMSQHDSLMPWLSTLNNVLLGHRLRGKVDQAIKEKAISLLEQAGLAKAINKRPSALSGGMKQRAALVRTLLEDKPIVLMDEPFSALDAITRLKLQELAYELLKNKTVVLVTHDPMEALRLCDQVFVLSGQPVNFDLATQLHSPAPRKLNDPELLKEQSKLLIQLEKAYEGCE